MTDGDIERITCPIGIPSITGKDPASIAVGVVADLLVRWETADAAAGVPGPAARPS